MELKNILSLLSTNMPPQTGLFCAPPYEELIPSTGREGVAEGGLRLEPHSRLEKQFETGGGLTPTGIANPYRGDCPPEQRSRAGFAKKKNRLAMTAAFGFCDLAIDSTQERRTAHSHVRQKDGGQARVGTRKIEITRHCSLSAIFLAELFTHHSQLLASSTGILYILIV
jgi:hypothetical protein